MKPPLLLLTTLLLTAVSSADNSPQIEYRFDEVKRRVFLTSGQTAEMRVGNGQLAHGGDKVQTGWFSYALIAAPTQKAQFEIFSATDVRLADGTPGVLLSLERGRIRAVFDKITGNEPRVVKTPGALLAVRGTDFVVEVDSEGKTVVDVFEGVVEIQSPLRTEPVFVRGGERSTFGRREAPRTRPMPEDRRREGETRGRGREGDMPSGGRRPDNEPRRDPGMGPGSGPGHPRSPQPGTQPPQPGTHPPRRPHTP